MAHESLSAGVLSLCIRVGQPVALQDCWTTALTFPWPLALWVGADENQNPTASGGRLLVPRPTDLGVLLEHPGTLVLLQIQLTSPSMPAKLTSPLQNTGSLQEILTQGWGACGSQDVTGPQLLPTSTSMVSGQKYRELKLNNFWKATRIAQHGLGERCLLFAPLSLPSIPVFEISQVPGVFCDWRGSSCNHMEISACWVGSWGKQNVT